MGSFGILLSMRKYELTLVLDAKATAAKKKSVGETIEKVVKVFKGKIEKTEDWGEKGSGQLLHFLLELDSASAKAIEAKLKAEESIVKYLIIRR